MRRAARGIRALGGAAAATASPSSTWRCSASSPTPTAPSVPPEMVLLPRWVYFNLYAMSSWTRTIVVPLSIFSAYKPVRQLPPENGHRASCSCSRRETPLWPHPPTPPAAQLDQLLPRRRLAVQAARAAGARSPVRRPAVRKAAAWMREHFADSDGLGAIFPPMIYTVIGLRCLGVPDDSPEMQLGAEAARRPDDRGRRHDPPAAVLLAGVGHGADAERPGRRRLDRRATRPSQAARLAAGAAKCGGRATGA